MIKMYVMHTCPDCKYVEKQVEGKPEFKLIYVGLEPRPDGAGASCRRDGSGC